MTPWFARMLEALDERLGLEGPGREVANKVFPKHWSFLLGEVALFSLVVLVLTGLFLAMFYRPSVDPVVYSGASALYDGRSLPAAYESIVRLSHDVDGGLLFRRIHRAASQLFVAAILGHLLRVVLTGAHRRPREVNYHVGVLLLVLAVSSGWSGHNLVYDVLAGTSLRIGYTLLLSVPFVGETLALWVFGGEFPTGNVLPRLYVVHVLLLPGLIIGLVSVHMAILVRQGHTQRPHRRVDGQRMVVGEPLWPNQFATSTSLMLFVGGTLTAAAVLVPWSDVDLHGPYIVAEATNASQPDWYLFWVEGALRLLPPWEWSLAGTTVSMPFVGGVLVPLLVVAGLFAYPFLERRAHPVSGDRHVLEHPWDVPFRAGMVAFGVLAWALLTVAAGGDVIARLTATATETVLWILRVAVLVVPPIAGLAVAWYARRQEPRWRTPPRAPQPRSVRGR